jgi:molecular chaperone GrpE
MAQLAAERDEYLADLQRLAAEFENYRKRAARDQQRLVAHAHERLVRELLPVLDDLERALEAAERHEEAALVDGVKLVEQSLRKALMKEGLVEIETDGAFDPHVHEALLAKPHEDAESNSVLEVVQRGYRLGNKVVRPAKVIVAE